MNNSKLPVNDPAPLPEEGGGLGASPFSASEFSWDSASWHYPSVTKENFKEILGEIEAMFEHELIEHPRLQCVLTTDLRGDVKAGKIRDDFWRGK